MGTIDYTYGNIIVEPIATKPLTITGAAYQAGKGNNKGYREVTMLSFFGCIIFDTGFTGFALGFIGDAHNSFVVFPADRESLVPISGQTTGAGRGIN